MKKFAVVLALSLLVLGSLPVHGAETEVNGKLYAHWMMDMTDGADNFNEFALGRAYVTVKSKLSDYTSVRITSDLRETGSFDGYSVIIKYAYLDWKPQFANGVLKLRLGLQPTQYIDKMNKLWGRRYLENTVGDLHHFLTTSDLGAGVIITLGEKGKLGYIAGNVWNGTSYTNVEELNKQKDFSGFVYFTPLKDNPDFKRCAILAQAYVGTQNRNFGDFLNSSDYDRSLFSFGALLAFRHILDIGADINLNSKGQGAGTDDLKETGYSAFATIYLEDLIANASLLRTLNLFGRMDMYDPNSDVDDNGNTLIIGGVECTPVKGFKASVNLRTLSYQAEDVDSETYVYVNTLFEF